MLVGTEGMRGELASHSTLRKRTADCKQPCRFWERLVPKMTNCVNHCAALCRLTGEFLTGEIERRFSLVLKRLAF